MDSKVWSSNINWWRGGLLKYEGRITTHCSNAEAHNQERNYLRRLFDSNGYPLNFIKRALRHRNSQPPPTTNDETVCPTWRALPYVKNVSELIARHLRPFIFFIAYMTPSHFVERL